MRLDQRVAADSRVRSRSAAAQLIRAGRVQLDGVPATKPGLAVTPDQRVDVDPDHWVSRAAHKLVGALDALQLSVPAVVLDAGASTGGFTQVCLERGAQRVYAVDVGHDQLDPLIRADPRVVATEGFNLRDLTPSDLPEPVELVVADVSFISLRLLLAPLLSVLAPEGTALLMVKPQFEVGRGGLDSRGVVKDPDQGIAAVEQLRSDALALGWDATPPVPSELPGENGNREYFIALTRAGTAADHPERDNT